MPAFAEVERSQAYEQNYQESNRTLHRNCRIASRYLL